MTDRLVWVDLETTGLDPATDLILEVAVVVTDPDLEVLAGDAWLIAHPRVVYETVDSGIAFPPQGTSVDRATERSRAVCFPR